jgi:hypothetical protein
MKIVSAILGTLSWFTLTGCQTVDADLDRPARIVNVDADSRAALQAAVNDALGTEVLLAQDALTDTSLLTIERWPAGTMENPVPQGRSLEKPVLFRLVINGSDCILIDQRNESRHVLKDTDCAAE